MQINKQQLQRQQIVLAFLGYYKHKCDGIWGPASIEAKRKFEGTREFAPALPNTGLPFAEKVKYPRGIYMGADKLLMCEGLSPDRIKELAGSLLIGDKSDTVVTEQVIPVIPKQEGAPVMEQSPPELKTDTPTPEVDLEKKQQVSNHTTFTHNKKHKNKHRS